MPTLDSTLGVLEIGVLLSVFLFGVATVQLYAYRLRFPMDPRHIKTLVSVVWILELGHTICISHAMYQSTVSFYGQPEKLTKFQSLNASILLGGMITLAVQTFFAIRVWRLAGSYLAVICLVLAFIRFLGCVLASAEAFKALDLVHYVAEWGWLLTTLLVVGATVDVIIAVLLCSFFMRERNSAFERTTKLLDRLIMWTIQTGLVTSIAAVVMVICFQTMKQNFIWLTIYVFLAKLYSNCLLASLNSRRKSRNSLAMTPFVEVSGFHFAPTSNAPAHAPDIPQESFMPTMSVGVSETTQSTIYQADEQGEVKLASLTRQVNEVYMNHRSQVLGDPMRV